MLELLTDPQAWMAFATLTLLELVLGIDNIIYISILVDKLPAHQREIARRLGLFVAMFMRIGLLLLLAWIVGLTAPLFSIAQRDISGRDQVLIAGGLFLLWKSASEIHQSLEGPEAPVSGAAKATFTAAILQIMLIDMVFSLDSIITAVGMVDQVVVMLAEGFGHHVPKGYIYSAMAFSLVVEMLNLRLRKRAPQPVHLHTPYGEGETYPHVINPPANENPSSKT